DEELAVHGAREVVGDHTGEDVGTAAGRRRNDDPHRPAGIVRLRKRLPAEEAEADKSGQQKASHEMSLRSLHSKPSSRNSRRIASGMSRAPGAARSRSRGASFGSR